MNLMMQAELVRQRISNHISQFHLVWFHVLICSCWSKPKLWLYGLSYKFAMYLRLLKFTKYCNLTRLGYVHHWVYCVTRVCFQMLDGGYPICILTRSTLCTWVLVQLIDALAMNIFFRIEIFGPSLWGDTHRSALLCNNGIHNSVHSSLTTDADSGIYSSTLNYLS